MSIKLICALAAAFFQSFAISTIIFKQVSKNNLNNTFLFKIIIFTYSFISFLIIPPYLRFILFVIIVSLSLYFVLKIRDKKIVLYSFNTQLILGISEVLISLLLLNLGMDFKNVINNVFNSLIINVLISLLSVLIVNLFFIKKIYEKIIQLLDKNNNLIKYFYILLFVIYIIFLKNGLDLLLMYNYYTTIAFIFIVIFILNIIIKNETKYEQLQEINKQMLNYVNKYEKIITEQGKANHEFKNQLMVIKGYAQMNSPKLLDYLNSIIEDSNKTHSSYLISQLNKFPDGGVKGLLYYKLSIIEEENIKYQINVQKGVKTSLNKLDLKLYKNITKILGVLFDNAIEACRKNKNKKIIIDVCKEKNQVIFSISNTFKGKIDIEKIGSGFTTKGSGHGYGLRLIDDIVSQNNELKVERILNDDYFITKLYINLKK